MTFFAHLASLSDSAQGCACADRETLSNAGHMMATAFLVCASVVVCILTVFEKRKKFSTIQHFVGLSFIGNKITRLVSLTISIIYDE